MSVVPEGPAPPIPVSVQQKVVNCLKYSCVREFIAEFFGTFILIALGTGGAASYVLRAGVSADILSICFCWGLGALVGITVSAPISGAHINPAVTISLATAGKFPWKKVLHYVAAQYLGGFVAALVIFLNYYEGIKGLDGGARVAYGNEKATGGIFATYPSDHTTIFSAFIDQVIGTGFLMFAIMVIVSKKGLQVPAHIQPLYLMFVIMGICVAFGLNAGAILNPARDFAPRLFTVLVGYGWSPFSPLGGHYWWVAGIAGPHVGALVGLYLYIWLIEKGEPQYSSNESDVVETPVERFEAEKDYSLNEIVAGKQEKSNEQAQVRAKNEESARNY